MSFLDDVAKAEGLVVEYTLSGRPYLTKPGMADHGWIIYQDDEWDYSVWEFDNNPERFYKSFATIEAAIKAAREELI